MERQGILNLLKLNYVLLDKIGCENSTLIRLGVSQRWPNLIISMTSIWDTSNSACKEGI